MKKLFSCVLAALLAAALTACGEKPVDFDRLEAGIAALSYPDALTSVDASMAGLLLSPDTLPEGTDARIAVNGTGYVRYFLCRCRDEAAGAECARVLGAYLERLLAIDYDPEETALLKRASLKRSGSCVALVIGADPDGVEEVLTGCS